MDENKIVLLVCEKFGVTVDVIFKKTRKRESVLPRQVAIVMLLFFTKITHNDIGTYFRMRDHTSVHHARKTIADLIDTDSEELERIAEVYAQVKKHYQPVVPRKNYMENVMIKKLEAHQIQLT